jgi:hypothetical protein
LPCEMVITRASGAPVDERVALHAVDGRFIGSGLKREQRLDGTSAPLIGKGEVTMTPLLVHAQKVALQHLRKMVARGLRRHVRAHGELSSRVCATVHESQKHRRSGGHSYARGRGGKLFVNFHTSITHETYGASLSLSLHTCPTGGNCRVSARADANEFRAQSGVRGLSIALRRRRAGGLRAAPLHGGHIRDGSPPVLFVHGATFPSALAADFPFGGVSWMETLAARGHDVWALDFLGYGQSDRYPEMAGLDVAGAALGTSSDAVLQIASAVEFIGAETRAARVAIVAHSWGCTPGGLFVTHHPARVESFVMFGPIVTRAGTPQRSPE